MIPTVYLVMSLFAFIVYASDKRAAVRGDWRVSESTLHVLELLGGWPGTKITTTKEINGETWYYKEFDVNTKDYTFNIIFNQGNGKKQTIDIGPLSEDTYYEIGEENNGKFTVNNLTGTITGISDTRMVKPEFSGNVYTIDGHIVGTDGKLEGLPKGIYIVNKKKIILK
jgi:alpha-amylase